MALRLRFLGTVGAVPEAGDESTCLLVNGHVLVDCGWNAVQVILRRGLDPLDVDCVLFTHFHPDHYLGLPHLLTYRAWGSRDVPPLQVVGPQQMLTWVVGRAPQFVSPTAARAHASELPLPDDRTTDWTIRGTAHGADDALAVSALPAVHTTPAVAYRFRDLASGRTFVHSGDTAFHPPLSDFAKGADALSHDSDCGPTPRERHGGHSSAEEAARIAQAAGVGRLYLVHQARAGREQSVAAARAVFPATEWAPEDVELRF